MFSRERRMVEPLGQTRPLHGAHQQCSHLGWTLGHDHIGLLQSLDLCASGSLRHITCYFCSVLLLTYVFSAHLSSTDDGSGVTHSPAGGRGHSGDEGHDRLGIRSLGL